jgi:hypothetical protein
LNGKLRPAYPFTYNASGGQIKPLGII